MLSLRRCAPAAVFFSISDSNIYHFCGVSAGAKISRQRRPGDRRRGAPLARLSPTEPQISELQMRRRPAQNKTNRRNLRGELV